MKKLGSITIVNMVIFFAIFFTSLFFSKESISHSNLNQIGWGVWLMFQALINCLC